MGTGVKEAYALSTCILVGFSPAEIVKFKEGQIPGTVLVKGNTISVALSVEVFEANFKERGNNE